MSAAALGKTFSEQHRANLSLARKRVIQRERERLNG
jgi:hypothetical protein